MDDIYRENILDHYKNPRNFGKLKNPTASFSLYNSACGDKITMELRVKNPASPAGKQESKVKIIDEIKFSGEGCAISMASASMLTEKVMGENIHKIKKLNMQDILDMLGITLTPTRLKCALLPLEVLQKAINS